MHNSLVNETSYADDTTLFSTIQSFKTSIKEVNVDTLIKLLKINKLSLNVSKPKYILVKIINKALDIPVFKIDATII